MSRYETSSSAVAGRDQAGEGTDSERRRPRNRRLGRASVRRSFGVPGRRAFARGPNLGAGAPGYMRPLPDPPGRAPRNRATHCGPADARSVAITGPTHLRPGLDGRPSHVLDGRERGRDLTVRRIGGDLVIPAHTERRHCPRRRTRADRRPRRRKKWRDLGVRRASE